MNDFEKAYLISVAPRLVHWHLWSHPSLKRGMGPAAADDFAWQKTAPTSALHACAKPSRLSKSPREAFWDLANIDPSIRDVVQENLETLLAIVRSESKDAGHNPKSVFKRRFGPTEWAAETVADLTENHGLVHWFFTEEAEAESYLSNNPLVKYALVLAPGPRFGFTLMCDGTKKAIELNEESQKKEYRFMIRDESGYRHFPTIQAAIADVMTAQEFLDPAKAMAIFDNLEPCLSLLSFWDDYP